MLIYKITNLVNKKVYKKNKNIWILNNKIININEYLLNNPVSTISVSGE